VVTRFRSPPSVLRTLAENLAANSLAKGGMRWSRASHRWRVNVRVGERGVEFGGLWEDIFGDAGDVEVDFKATKDAVAQDGRRELQSAPARRMFLSADGRT
jgi:hypothetical protein